MDERSRKLIEHIRDVPDFPKPGILFKDVTPLLANGPAFQSAIELLAEKVVPHEPDLLVGIESRGFIFGGALADRMRVGFAPVRKPGKLPFKARRETYTLEYGTDALEMHEDAALGKSCVIVDDLLATGGTAAATSRLIERLGGKVLAFAFVIELDFLKGREKLGGRTVHSLIHY